jgi:23S rRNA (uracil1939-C5)-methyltransferase
VGPRASAARAGTLAGAAGAPCRFYAECGGCTLEHLEYEAQLRAKARIVADALTRIGKLELEPPEVVASPSEFRYRNRVSFALRRVGAGRVVAGFHALGDPDRIVDIDGSCLLPEEPISRVWDRLRANWGPDARHLPSGERLRLTLRASGAGEVSLLVEGGFAPGRPEELLEAVEGLTAIWHRPGTDPAELIAGAPGLPEVWGDEELSLSGAAFLQVNRAAATLLEAHVLDVVGDAAELRVIDAYCGIGLHARRLARAGARVTGIELDPQAVEEAARGAPVGAEFVEGAVEAVLPARLPADLVILNPPRAGVAPEVAEALVATPPRRIVYISCNPATLARDLARMRSAFRLEHVRAFDLFPQTAHVETVVVLSSLNS